MGRKDIGRRETKKPKKEMKKSIMPVIPAESTPEVEIIRRKKRKEEEEG